jgi:3D (Asp-Asp-Asp) domain-containing protein
MIAAAAVVAVATAYAPGCGATGLTKAGTTPVPGFTIAADPEHFPLGTLLEIEGLGVRMVHDTGALIKGKVIDLYVCSCRVAREWGRRTVRVRVIHVGGTR